MARGTATSWLIEFLGTKKDNTADMVRKGRHAEQRKTHCKHGHEFTPENVRINSDGHRCCRTCLTWWTQYRRDRRRSAARLKQASPLPF